MSLTRLVAPLLASVSLVATAACDDGLFEEFPTITRSSSAALVGDIAEIRNIDAVGEAQMDDYGYAEVTVPVPEGIAMLILFGEYSLKELPAGTVLHRFAPMDDGFAMEAPVLLDDRAIDDALLIEDAGLDVMLCGGDEGFDEGIGEDGEDDAYWVDVPAEETLVEITATDDPNVNAVTVTAGVENPETGETDIVSTSFTVAVD